MIDNFVSKTVLVAGAGIAGLACSSRLIKAGFQVILMEASDHYGGRIKVLENFLNKPIEVGGQDIHYQKTVYYDMALQAGAELEDDTTDVDVIWDPYQKKMIESEQLEEKYPKVDGILDYFADHHLEWTEDMSTRERLQQLGMDMKFQHYYECLMGAEYSAPMGTIGSFGVGMCEATFQCDVNFNFTNINHITILDKFYQSAIDIIKYNCPIVEVVIQNDKVNVKYMQSEVVQKIVVDYFVSAIPITQVKKIKWTPSFSQERQSQLDLVTMSEGGKLFIKLNKHLKNKKWGYIIIDSKPDIQMWNNSNQEESCLVVLLSKQGSQEIDQYGVEKYVNDLIRDLNQQCEEDVEILKIHFMDWGKEQYIEGVYSYPLPGVKENYRQIIGEPVENKIFFCGEAYHNVHWASIHGAMETGYNVADKIKNL